MAEKKDTLNPDILTDEIEDTIDDLFKPSRQIEIDPLTNEVKEVAEGKSPDEASADMDLHLEPLIPASPTTDESSGEEKPEENLLELELELEPDSEAGKEGLPVLLDNLDQQLSTLEWEITPEQVAAAIGTMKGINAEPGIRDISEARHLIRLMLDILGRMEDQPETIAANSPVILKKGLENLKQLATQYQAVGATLPEDLAKGFETTALELERILEEEERPGETGEGATDIIPDTSEAGEIQVEPEDDKDEDTCPTMPSPLSSRPDSLHGAVPADDTSEKSQPVTVSHLRGPAEPRPESVVSSPSEVESLHLLDEHIDVLVSCIEKIIPVEALLKNTSGMEKLYKFQEGIRSILEKEAMRLAKLTGRELRLPDVESFGMPKTSEQKPVLPPCDTILTINWGGKRIALSAEEVCFHGPPVWSMKRKLGSLSTFPLKGLKKWPWSKIRPMLNGKLAGLDEDALKQLEFPVVGPELVGEGGIGNRDGCACQVVIIMYDGSKGITILCETEPVSESTLGMSWEPTQKAKEPFEGILKNGEKTIPLCTVKSVLRAWQHD